jgi:hypothetical protein
MLRYNIIGKSIEFRTLAELPKELASSYSIWPIIQWGAASPSAMFDDMPMKRVRKFFQGWEKDSGVELGQIRSLLALVEKHSAPLEFDLIRYGLRLRHCPSEEFNWRDLWIFVSHIEPTSALFSAVNPDGAGWDKSNMLLAEIADSTAWLVWAKTKAAQKGGSPPDRIPRPGVAKKKHRDGSRVKPVPLQRIKEVYGINHDRNDPSRGRKLTTLFQ